YRPADYQLPHRRLWLRRRTRPCTLYKLLRRAAPLSQTGAAVGRLRNPCLLVGSRLFSHRTRRNASGPSHICSDGSDHSVSWCFSRDGISDRSLMPGLPHDSLAPSAHGPLPSASQIRSDLARRIFRGALILNCTELEPREDERQMAAPNLS